MVSTGRMVVGKRYPVTRTSSVMICAGARYAHHGTNKYLTRLFASFSDSDRSISFDLLAPAVCLEGFNVLQRSLNSVACRRGQPDRQLDDGAAAHGALVPFGDGAAGAARSNRKGRQGDRTANTIYYQADSAGQTEGGFDLDPVCGPRPNRSRPGLAVTVVASLSLSQRIVCQI